MSIVVIIGRSGACLFGMRSFSHRYLVLDQLWQRPSDVLLEPVESHGRLIRQDVHALGEFVAD